MPMINKVVIRKLVRIEFEIGRLMKGDRSLGAGLAARAVAAKAAKSGSAARVLRAEEKTRRAMERGEKSRN
jgi:hypothetical protein